MKKLIFFLCTMALAISTYSQTDKLSALLKQRDNLNKQRESLLQQGENLIKQHYSLDKQWDNLFKQKDSLDKQGDSLDKQQAILNRWRDSLKLLNLKNTPDRENIHSRYYLSLAYGDLANAWDDLANARDNLSNAAKKLNNEIICNDALIQQEMKNLAAGKIRQEIMETTALIQEEEEYEDEMDREEAAQQKIMHTNALGDAFRLLIEGAGAIGGATITPRYAPYNQEPATTIYPTLPGTDIQDLNRPGYIIEGKNVYPTVPGTDIRDYGKPGAIIEGNIIYQTLPGTNLRDYNKPGYKIK